jgi:hypothetical protein
MEIAMTAILRSVLIALLLCAASYGAYAQIERQISFDEAGKIFVVSKSMNDEYKWFEPIETFLEARLFKMSDSAFVLEILRRADQGNERERRQLSMVEMAALRSRIQTAASPSVDIGGLDQSGRSTLLWGSTLWSLFYYGTAVSIVFSSDGSVSSAPTYLIAGGLGYFVPALLTQNANVTAGAASLAVGGMFQGALHGWALGGLISGSNLSSRTGFALSILGGVSETVAGYVIGSNTGISEGAAGVINTTEFYGAAGGALAALTIMGNVTEGDAGIRVLSGLGLVGAAGGILLGNEIIKSQHITNSDATVYALTGALGLGLPYAVLSAVSPDNVSTRVITGIGLLGAAGGLYLGTRLIDGLDYREGDGSTFLLSTLAGGVIGVGIAQLVDSPRAIGPLVWASAAGGFLIGRALARPDAEGTSMGKLDVNFNPLGLVLGARSNVPMPIGSVTYRF